MENNKIYNGELKIRLSQDRYVPEISRVFFMEKIWNRIFNFFKK